MANYNFSALNDKDLEELVRDLFIREFSVNFQSFKVGKDKGIDLRYATTENENEIIVQVKHYIKTSISKFIYILKAKELEKIEKLAPKRYIIVTALQLLPQNKEKIKGIFKPFIQTTNDIFGYDDLNGLANKYPDIVKYHYKLWFANSETLERIINNGIIGRSEFIESKIIKNIGLIVRTKSTFEALKILEKENFLIITGDPGVGKTTLAHLLIYSYLAKGFRLVYMDGIIAEGDKIFDPDPNVKQIFFLDDFLGVNYLEIINPINKDTSIINFIDRFKDAPNKYLILTTRTTILNQAYFYQEKLKRANLNLARYEIILKVYNNLDKAKILYNHLYFNEIHEEYLLKIFENKSYWTIINDKNYNPRLIEFITTPKNYLRVEPNEFLTFIKNTLKHPEEVWKFAYENQLNDEERFLLITLLSFGRSAEYSDLEDAFEAKIVYEIRNNNYKRINNSFNNSFKTLLDGYIKNTIQTGFNYRNWVETINPSLNDFLIYYLSNSSSEKWRALEAFIFIEQYQHIFRLKDYEKNKVEIKTTEIPKLLDLINSKPLRSINKSLGKNDMALKLMCLILFFKAPKSSDTYIEHLLSIIDWDHFNLNIFDDLKYILRNPDGFEQLQNFIGEHWDDLICKMIKIARHEDDLGDIKELFILYDVSYDDFIEDYDHNRLVSDSLDNIFNSIESDIMSEHKKNIMSKDDLNDVLKEIANYYKDMNQNYLSAWVDYPGDPYQNIDTEKLIEENLNRIGEEEAHQDDWKDIYNESQNINEQIDDLFSR